MISKEKQKAQTVKLKFTGEQMGWIQSAADMLTEGNTTDLIMNCFWNDFEKVSKAIADQLMNEPEKH